jgi:hypothetical protein
MAVKTATFRTAQEATTFMAANGLGLSDVRGPNTNSSGMIDIFYESISSAVDSLEFTLTDAAPYAVLPVPYLLLNTVKARLALGGLLSNGSVRIFDGNPTAAAEETILYDSGVVAWTASATTGSVADVLSPTMPITSNFAADPISGDPQDGAILVLTPTVATGPWSVIVRLTTSRG